MNFKRCMFLTLMLFLTIFSISFVAASENVTYGQNTGELNTLSISDVNPIEGTPNTLAVDSIDEADDDSLGTASEKDEIETDGYNKTKTQLLRSSNDVEISNDDENILGAGNDLQILGASNDEPVLGTNQYLNGGTAAQVIQAIRDCSDSGGGTVYLNGGTYTGSGSLNAGQNTIINIRNVRVVGGSETNPNLIATFNPGSMDSTSLSFNGAGNWDGTGMRYTSNSGVALENVRFENLVSTGRFFNFNSGSLTNCVFNNIESYQHFVFFTGSYNDATPLPVTNCNFTNCRQTYVGDNPEAGTDGGGQFGVIFGAKLVGCNFINTSSATHGGAFCLSDEWPSAACVASSLTDCNFINITSRWFAVYIHGNYTNTPRFITEPQVLDNCKFINCTGTGEYGAALGISHNNVIIRNTEFINNTGGMGSAIMVGGIDNDHEGFLGVNTEGNNMTIDNCIFINNVAKVEGQSDSYSPTTGLSVSPTGDAGAIYVYGNDTKIFNTIFENNTASNNGGAVYIEGWGTHFENSTLSGSSAVNGTIYIEGPNTRVINSTLSDNTATNGAGVYIIGENTYIADSEFYNNIADPDSGVGGAIDVIGDHCTLVTVTCNNNTASRGGAGFIRGNNTVVRNSTFDNNNATFIGGGLDVYGNNFNADNLEVSNNNAGTDGGAVYVRGNDATFTDVISINNTASRGGSTFILGDNIYVTNCTLDGNKALFNGTEGSGRGGALDLAGTNCHVSDLEVSNNYADNEGGAIYIKSDNLDIFDIISIDNSANLGGSTFIEGDNIVLHDCTFDGNNATLRGGGLNILGENCTVYNVDVSDNNAGTEGGAVYVRGNDATFTNVTSFNNTASRGGSTFIVGDNAEVHNCTLDNNKAIFNGTEGSGRGGGIDIAGENCKVYDLEVSNNYADREGGAIYIKSSDLNIYEIDSLNNTASRGGSIFIEGDNITVSNSVFNNNKAIFNESDPENSGIGGAIDILGNDCKFINVTSVNNTAYRGGSTFVRGNNTVIQDCILDNNTATLRGGGINVAGDNCTIENVEVSNNKAGLMGGAIYVNSNGTTLTNIIADNNTAERGGAAFINGTNIIVRGGELNNNKAIFNESNPDESGLGGAFDIVGDHILVENVHSNNNTAYRGGSSFIRGDNVTVQNCNLDNNSATLRGGGINIAGDSCNIENVSVSNNKAGLMGGAIYVNSEGSTLTNIIADNNTAERGGAAFINGTSVTVRGGELNNNKAIFNESNPDASGLGGAFDIVGSNILFDDIISNNNTAYRGGSAFIRGTNVTVQNSNLDNNSATLNGGALNIGGGEGSQIINVSASDNKAGKQGGAVYVNGNKAYFDNVTSIHNTAEEGGSSYIEGNETTVKNCNLDNNVATLNGGGLAVSGHNGNFENVALSNCNASEFGGAVYVIGDNNTFNNVTSIHNTANYGGSSYIAGDNTVVENCNLDNNIATVNGGGVYIDGKDCNITNVNLSNCRAGEEGGAVYITGDSAYLNKVTSSNNTADYYGGSTAIYGDNVNVKNSEFIDNNANGGGAIYISGDEGYFSNNNILSNDAEMGGGIYVTGDNCEFSQNNISYNDANFGGGVSIFGSNSIFDNNNITYNHADTSGGAIYVSGWEDEISYFAYNNISSNHAENVGGGIFSEDENLYLDHIYAFNNTALKGGFADINNAPALVVSNSTFDNNHALGYINDGYGMGGAFFISNSADATIDGNFYNNTAEYGNGSAIYVEDSKLRVHDSSFFDNLALSYALPILPEKGTTYMVGEPIYVTIWHIGGDNIANAIHNKDAQSNVTINNITYEFYNHGSRTIKTTSNTDEIPVIGFENSDDGEKVYLDDLEDNQPIYYQITKIGAGDYPDPSDITDISGSISFTLNDLDVGRYLIQAIYYRTTYYTEILNQTWIRIIDVSSINVTKVWEDEDDFDGIRPSNVTVLLYNDTGLINQTVLDSSNNWTYSFEGLLIYDEDGINLINYTIEEVPIDGYATVITNITGDHSINLTITNIHVPLTSVNVTKVWNDGNNADNTRPENITVVLLENGIPIDTAVLNASNNWYWSFTNLTVFNGEERIKYTISEINVTGYISVVTNSTLYNWTITNTELVNITIIKVWTDNNDQDGLRPVNVTVSLFADDELVGEVTLNETNNWTYTFEDLIKFNVDGTLVEYRVNETEVVNYTAVITRDNNDFLINNTHIAELINVTVVKVWNDGNNVSGKRPANVTVVLLADGESIRTAILNTSNDWTFTFEGLDKFKNNGTLIEYSIDEVDVGVPGYTTAITNSTPYYWIVNNTYVPKVNKTANETQVYYHDFVLYNITITNVGTGIYNETLTIIDSLPYGLDYNKTVNITGARVIQEGIYDNETRTVTWIITDIDPNVPAIIFVLVGTYDIGNLTNNVTLIGPNGFNDTVNATVEVLPGVDLSVVKTVDKAQHTIDDLVVWTVTVSNAVNGTNATNVVLNDTFPPAGFIFVNYTASAGTVYDHSTGIWTIGDMANGTSVTLTINTRAKQNGTFTNHANVTCDETEWNYTNNYDNATVVIVGVPINKTVNNATPFYNANVTYNLTVTNIGNFTYLDNITVVDSLPDGLTYIRTLGVYNSDVVVNATVDGNNVTWVITNIDPNTTAVISVLVNVHAINNLTNNETVILPNGTNMTVNVTVVPQPYVDVSVVKTVDKPVHFVDDTVVWTITVSNAVNGTNATNVVLNDTFPPAGFIFVNYTATAGTVYDHSTGIWTIGDMANGTSVTLTINSIAKAIGTFTNHANVTCDETEWNYTNNYDNATVVVFDIPDINKTVNNTTPFYKEYVLYNITITNVGNVTYTETLTVVDSLPEGLEYNGTVSITGAGIVQNAVVDQTGQVVTWKITNITADVPAIITVKARANVLGNLTNNATEIAPNGTNKTVNCTIEVQPLCDLAIFKSVNATRVYLNEFVEWTITVVNYGPNTAKDVVVKDNIPAGLIVTKATPSVGTFNMNTGIWSIGDLENNTSLFLVLVTQAVKEGSITNVVVVNTTTNETNYTNNKANNTTVVIPICDVEITKVVNLKKVYVGEDVIWTIKVKNNGPSIAANVKVTDLLPKGLKVLDAKVTKGSFNMNTYEWTLNSLARGASETLKLTTKVLRVGLFTNPASVETTTVEYDYTNNKANDTTEGIPIVDLSLTKDSDKSVYHKGDKMYWTINVINYGPSTATDVVVNDVLPSGVKFIRFVASKGTFDASTGKWNIGELAKGESATLEIYCEVIAEIGTITNFASVTCNETDKNPDNNNDSATITVVKVPDEPVPPKMHPTGNPIVMVVLSLLAIVGVTLRRKL